MGKDTSFLRKIPAVQTLLEHAAAAPLLQAHGREEVVAALRKVLDALREEARTGAAVLPDPATLLGRAARLLDPPVRRVINATGVLIHTHLGRSPLPQEGGALPGGYMNLEIALDDGSRGNRNVLVADVLARLTGAEDAVAVNNNAAAVLLMLSAFARGREVLISRGELVEIGGSFRVPEILEQSGCVLREVGTTNRTTLADYLEGVTERTAGVLKVHPSNFRIQGFTSSVSVRALSAALHERGLLLWVDQGCGLVRPVSGFDLGDEEPVTELISAGADLVCFSGDKLLGGPQAGLAVGRKELIGRMLHHPLYRALRPGKETFVRLQAVLSHHLSRNFERIPLWAMARTPVEALEQRARRILKRLPGPGWKAVEAKARFGGGTTPLLEFPSAALRWAAQDPQAQLSRLLSLDLPVLAYIQDEALLFNLRTVFPEEDVPLADAIREVAGM